MKNQMRRGRRSARRQGGAASSVSARAILAVTGFDEAATFINAVVVSAGSSDSTWAWIRAAGMAVAVTQHRPSRELGAGWLPSPERTNVWGGTGFDGA
jgi:hypothetical protein